MISTTAKLTALGMVLALGCANGSCQAGSPNERAAAAPTEREQGLPPPEPVCVQMDDGALRWGMAKPSRAGVYDPSAPVNPAHLNWSVEGVGCVTYPGAAKKKEACASDQPPAALVNKTLCQQ